MPSPRKKSFAAEQLARQKKKSSPVVWVLAGIFAVILIAGVYMVYSRFTSQETTIAERGKKPSIAVLPFYNLSDDTEDEYFSDGFTDDIIIHLQKINRLNVRSFTSVMQYKKKRDKSLVEIARELNVDVILEGTVRRSVNSLIINAQLIEAENDVHLWGHKYEQKPDDIFSIQENITQAVLDKLNITLLDSEKEAVDKRYTENTEAYDLYLQGRFFLAKRTEEGFYKGIELFEKAIDTDPDYAKAYTGIADCYCYLSVYYFIPPTEGYPQAKEYVYKALEIDSTLSEAHISMGLIHLFYDWDFPAAEREFLKAIELDPYNTWAHYAYSFYLTTVGRHNEAITKAKEILKQEPLSVFYNTGTCMALYRARRYDEALHQLHAMLELDSNYSTAHSYLGFVYAAMGMGVKAIEAHRKALSLTEDLLWAVAGLGYAYGISGKKEEAYKLLKKYSDAAKTRYIPPMVFFVTYTGLGEKDKAFEHLDKAYLERDHNIIHIKVDPLHDSLRSDKRFDVLLRKMNYPED